MGELTDMGELTELLLELTELFSLTELLLALTELLLALTELSLPAMEPLSTVPPSTEAFSTEPALRPTGLLPTTEWPSATLLPPDIMVSTVAMSMLRWPLFLIIRVNKI